MLKNYLHVAIRNIKNSKGISLINIVGLAIGITCCIAIFLYVKNELSYDTFNKKADQIYRVYLNGKINGRVILSASSTAPLGEEMTKELPEVLNYVRVRSFGIPVIRYKDKIFSEDKFYLADSTFFDVFTVKFLEGDPSTALTKPNTVVITKEMAEKYFGSEDPIGKILNADKKRDYIVTGVVEKFPANSHFHFDFLGSLSTYEDSRNPFWLSNNYYTYLLLSKGTDVKVLQEKINSVVRKFVAPQVQTVAGISLSQFLAAGNKYDFELQPLKSIHLHSHLEGEVEPNSDINYIYIFSAIGLAILLIACINFMNLSTAKSEKRAKEVGIRKTLGSNKGQLIKQFIVESILMSCISVVLAIGLLEILLPVFNNVSGKNISPAFLENFHTIPLLICFAIVVGLIAGIYPAFILSAFNPVDVLKSKTKRSGKGSGLRSGLVIFQFAISIILIISTFIIYNQLNFIRDKNLGFNKDHILVIKRTDDLGSKSLVFQQELKNNPDIKLTSASNTIPGKELSNSSYKLKGASSNDLQLLWQLYTDYNFAKTYQLKLLKGRYFSKDHPSDTLAVVLNEAAVKAFNLKNPIGKEIIKFGASQDDYLLYKIIGVVKNFNFQSLHQSIRPLVMVMFSSDYYGRFISVRMTSADYTGTISLIQKTWKKFAGGEALSYNFFDSQWSALYFSEQKTGQLATTFSILAIFIACLGLLGLAAFVAEQRTKEIGIRKVLGASISEIIVLLSKDFIKWVLIANIIAWPVAYYFMNNWLKDFAYRISIPWWIFPASGIIAFIIALVTVSSQTLKASVSNPVNALKYE
ncbi:MAG TPA: ABC transporter permease [Ignavibacteriaceae bacterium]|nr:ABC transporter permease [Ignavibacteriaceae bacterium]